MRDGCNIADYAVYNTINLQICICTCGCISRNFCVFKVRLNFLTLLYKYIFYNNYFMHSALQDQQLLNVILCNPT